MAAYQRIIFIMSSYCLLIFADGRSVHHSAGEQEFQPFCSRMCDSSSDSREENPFQYKCSCSQSCAVYDDCCYDSSYKDTQRTPEYQFVCLPVHNVGDFQAVSSCSSNSRSDSCRDYLGLLPPVTSTFTNITYGNVFCASCNDDGDSLIRWNVELRCAWSHDLLDFGLDYTKIEYTRGKFWGRSAVDRTWRECKFYVTDLNYKFSSNLELRPCVKQQMESLCSTSWKDFSVEQKCWSYEDPVYIRNKVYRNPHCAECNYKKLRHAKCIPSFLREMLRENLLDEDYIRTCMARSPHTCIHDLYTFGRGLFYDMASMYDNTQQSLTDINERQCLPPRGKLCCDGERYDDYTRQCRRVRKSG